MRISDWSADVCASDLTEQAAARQAEAERLEAERLEAERLEAERLEAERLEAEHLEAERLEAERLEAERVEAERLEAARASVEKMPAVDVDADSEEPAVAEIVTGALATTRDPDDAFDLGDLDPELVDILVAEAGDLIHHYDVLL